MLSKQVWGIENSFKFVRCESISCYDYFMNFNANIILVVHYLCRQYYRMKFQFLNTNLSFKIYLCKNRSNIHFCYTLHIFHRKLARRNLQSVNQLANFSNHQPIYKRNPDTFLGCVKLQAASSIDVIQTFT